MEGKHQNPETQNVNPAGKPIKENRAPATVPTPATPPVPTPTGDPEKKKRQKLTKTIEGHKVFIEVGDGPSGKMEFDFDSLPPDIKDKLAPFGLGHKLGDAAAGRDGKDAEDAIKKVFDGLMKNDWSVRAPAAPKVSSKELLGNIAKLPPDQQAGARALLASLGIKLD